jgi:tetratricopeptide (TPR) repeat protein
MTEEAAIARRLYQAERWREAEAALRRVWTGETGDDEGERQIAEFHLATTLYRMGRPDESLDMFAAISRRPHHLEYQETRLWLAKLATMGQPFLDRAGRALARYAARDRGAPRDVPSTQRELSWTVQHVIGRQLYRTGQYETAIDHLEQVPPQSEFHDVARRCIALCRQHLQAAGGPGQ